MYLLDPFMKCTHHITSSQTTIIITIQQPATSQHLTSSRRTFIPPFFYAFSQNRNSNEFHETISNSNFNWIKLFRTSEELWVLLQSCYTPGNVKCKCNSFRHETNCKLSCYVVLAKWVTYHAIQVLHTLWMSSKNSILIPLSSSSSTLHCHWMMMSFCCLIDFIVHRQFHFQQQLNSWLVGNCCKKWRLKSNHQLRSFASIFIARGKLYLQFIQHSPGGEQER